MEKTNLRNSRLMVIALFLACVVITPVDAAVATKDNSVAVNRCTCLCVGPTNTSPMEVIEIWAPNCVALNDRSCRLKNGESGTRATCREPPNGAKPGSGVKPGTNAKPGTGVPQAPR